MASVEPSFISLNFQNDMDDGRPQIHYPSVHGLLPIFTEIAPTETMLSTVIQI